MSFENIISRNLESIAVKQRTMSRENNEVLAPITEAVIASLGNGGKLLLRATAAAQRMHSTSMAEFVARL